jgi:hypothetical protein
VYEKWLPRLKEDVIEAKVFLQKTFASNSNQSQNQTWQVQKKTCQVKIKFGRCS